MPGGGWVDDVGLPGAQGGRRRDDPVAGGEEPGIDGGAEGVDLADPRSSRDREGGDRVRAHALRSEGLMGAASIRTHTSRSPISAAGSSATLRTLSGGPCWSRIGVAGGRRGEVEAPPRWSR